MAIQQPNIIIYVSHDTGRFISPYGIPTVSTPHAERVAAEGALFTHAFCTAPQCSPSRAGLFTGRHPHSVGVLGLTGAKFGWTLHPSEKHMAQYCREAGYDTALIGIAHEAVGAGGDPNVLRHFGFDDISNEKTNFPSRLAGETLSRYLKHRKNKNSPFFTQIGVIETHRSYLRDHGEPDDSLGVTVPDYLHKRTGTVRDHAELQGIVKRWDEGLGDVLKVLVEEGLADNTLLIVTTDHGLANPRAKTTLYDAGMETMLIIRYPKHVQTGVRYDDLISNVDILPTLLEAAGIPCDGDLHGRSFWPLLTGANYTPNSAIFAEKTFHTAYDPMRCIRTNRYKYIRNFEAVRPEDSPLDVYRKDVYMENIDKLRGKVNPKEELYDLVEDPGEWNNLAEQPDYDETKRELAAQLGQWMFRTNDPLLQGPIASPYYYQNIEELKRLSGIE